MLSRTNIPRSLASSSRVPTAQICTSYRVLFLLWIPRAKSSRKFPRLPFIRSRLSGTSFHDWSQNVQNRLRFRALQSTLKQDGTPHLLLSRHFLCSDHLTTKFVSTVLTTPTLNRYSALQNHHGIRSSLGQRLIRQRQSHDAPPKHLPDASK